MDVCRGLSAVPAMSSKTQVVVRKKQTENKPQQTWIYRSSPGLSEISYRLGLCAAWEGGASVCVCVCIAAWTLAQTF